MLAFRHICPVTIQDQSAVFLEKSDLRKVESSLAQGSVLHFPTQSSTLITSTQRTELA